MDGPDVVEAVDGSDVGEAVDGPDVGGAVDGPDVGEASGRTVDRTVGGAGATYSNLYRMKGKVVINDTQ